MKRLIVPLLLLLLLLLFAACGEAAPAASPVSEPASGEAAAPAAGQPAPGQATAPEGQAVPEPAPEASAPTPEPTPEPTPAPTEWTILTENAEEILALAQIPSLRHINATASREYEALVQLQQLLPDCEIEWQVPLQGTNYPGDTEELYLSSTEGLEEAMAALPCLRLVDLTSCSPDHELMERLYDDYPQVEFLWNVHFGWNRARNWTVRSDITCFSALFTGDEDYRYTEYDYYPLLRFCRHLRALDLGHSNIEDISLIGNLTELQVLILADNPRITDISPLENLTELRYLELFMCYNIRDFTCFYYLHKMVDMNMSYCRFLDDVSFIDGMPDFQKGWFRNTQITFEMLQPYIETREGIDFMIASPVDDLSSTIYGWRIGERSEAIRHAFADWRNVKEFRSWDDIEYYTG